MHKPTTAMLTMLAVGSTSLILAGPPSAATMYNDTRADPTSVSQQARGDGRVVARRDVDGDGRRDVVRYEVLRDDLVQVTVQTAAGRTAAKRLNTQSWPRGRFHGAAQMDGRPGFELVIGTSAGAHTAWFTVLTWRHGDLIRESGPGRWQEWAVDAAYSIYLGWFRRISDGRVRMTERHVFREASSHHWTGRATTYTWRPGQGWKRSSSHAIDTHGDHRASRIGGWHVQGLKRYPW